MSIFCSKCGTELDDGAMFCPKCGTKVAKPQESTPAQPEMVYDPNHKKEQYAELMRTNDKFRKLVKYNNINLICSAISIVVSIIIMVIMINLKLFSFSEKFGDPNVKMTIKEVYDLSKSGYFELFLEESNFSVIMKTMYPIWLAFCFVIVGLCGLGVLVAGLNRNKLVKIFLQYEDKAVFDKVSRRSSFSISLTSFVPILLALISPMLLSDQFKLKVPTETGYKFMYYSIWSSNGYKLFIPGAIALVIVIPLLFINEFGFSKEICSFYKGKKTKKFN